MKNIKIINKDGQISKLKKETFSNREESIIQSKCVEWFKNTYCLKHHIKRFDIFSVPNEATYKNNQFKAMGVRNGASDLVVVLKNKVLFIEMKDPKGNQSESQLDFQNVVTNLNHEYHIIRSLEQFKELIWHELT
jgi:hypothetical protein